MYTVHLAEYNELLLVENSLYADNIWSLSENSTFCDFPTTSWINARPNLDSEQSCSNMDGRLLKLNSVADSVVSSNIK